MKRLSRLTTAAFALGLTIPAARAAEQYFSGDGSALTSATAYGVSATGPFNTSFTSGNIFGYGNTNPGTGTGGSITVGGFDFTQSFTLTSASGTISNASNGVVTISVSGSAVADFSSESFTTASGAGYIKSGTGVVALSGGTYGGGFTLNAGTVIARGVNAMGSGSTLTINGGIIAGNATRDLSGKYTGGITVGGDFQLGILAANSPISNGTALIASDTYNLTFSNNIALGTATARTITLGNRGTQTLGGVISGSSGLTFAAVSGAESTVTGNGVIAITGTSNTFTGAININGPEVTFAGDGSLGNTANAINIDGGRFTVTATTTLTAGRGIQVGGTAGTSISTKGGTTVVTYNGVIADKSGSTGFLAKQGSGTLALGGVSTYGGDTAINNGALQLTTGDNRLPTGTAISLGQAASANIGTFDLNGRSQQVAGLNSTTGTNASTTAKNTVTSATAATLTLGGSGTYAYGDGTAANSGVLTGSLAVTKSGGGTQTLGDANTYSGGTAVNGGKLIVASAATVSATGTGAVSVGASGTLASAAGTPATTGTGTITGLVTTAAKTSVLAPGATAASNTGTVGALTLAGGLNVSAGTTIPFDLGTSGNSDLITVSGGTFTGGTAAGSVAFNFNTTQTSGTYALISYVGATASGVDLNDFAATGAAGAFSFNGSELDFTITAVPEPATLCGGALLAVAAGWSQRRRLSRLSRRLRAVPNPRGRGAISPPCQ